MNKVLSLINQYPEPAKTYLLKLRGLARSIAAEQKWPLEETLKWGQPSFLTPQGSTLRMDWQSKIPDQVTVFCHCQTSLIATFKELYGAELHFEGKRAIILPLGKKLPEAILRHCIYLTLNYHQLKHLPLLGAVPEAIKPEGAIND